MLQTETKNNQEQVYKFLLEYGGFPTSDAVQDFVDELPTLALDLAQRIRKSLLEDKTFSKE